MRFIKKMAFVIVFIALLVTPVLVIADSGGFDEWGYNYKAHIYNGRYCDYDRVAGGDFCDVKLVMKWNDAWLSKDRVRPDTYINSGAWVTNHQFGSYIGDDGFSHDWDYFVKIVAMPSVGYDCSLSGGYPIWGQFCVVQSIYNDPYAGAEGNEFPPVKPGLGNF